MQLLSSTGSTEAASCGLEQAKAWDNLVKIRLSLQKPLELGNELPVQTGSSDERKLCSTYIRKSLSSLERIVVDQLPATDKSRKRARIEEVKNFKDLNSEEIWNHLNDTHKTLQPQWKAVTDKWHARLNFGSEQAKSKLKVLNYSMWDQIDNIITDENKFIEKTYGLYQDSKRHDKESNNHDNNNENSKLYDFEVYDDNAFYSSLLKNYINSNTEITNNSDYVLNADELKELRKYKKNPNGKNVDRKASKGRKIRYVPHVKLQNFMFPIANNGSREKTDNYDAVSLLDSDRLMTSLFQ